VREIPLSQARCVRESNAVKVLAVTSQVEYGSSERLVPVVDLATVRERMAGHGTSIRNILGRW
jgi:hypothetical protein